MKNKFISIIFILFILGCNLENKKDTKNITNDNPIVCFGDSLTFGYGIGTENSYPSVLQNKVNVEVVNSGISGDNTTGALNRVVEDVVDRDPIIAIIEFGANDLFNKTDPLVVKNNLIKIIDKIKTDDNEIFLVRFFTKEMELNTTHIAGYKLTIDDKALIAKYYNIYDEIAKEKDIYLIDNFWDGVWGKDNMILFDGVHPNINGTKVIAENVYKSISHVLDSYNLHK